MRTFSNYRFISSRQQIPIIFILICWSYCPILIDATSTLTETTTTTTTTSNSNPSNSRQRPIIRHRKLLVSSPDSHVVENSYIVVFNNNIIDDQTKLEESMMKYESLLSASTPNGDTMNESSLPTTATSSSSSSSFSIEHEGSVLLQGMSITDASTEVLETLLADDNVQYIEPDQYVTADTIQNGAPWNLDQLDDDPDVKLMFNRKFLRASRQYTYTKTGRGVNIYIVDSGIRFTHKDFTNRVSCGYDHFQTTSCYDGYGHGTHVAGTAAGYKYGVAKEANIIAVKVLDNNGSGSVSGVLKGIEYIVQQRTLNPTTPMIANLSIGTGVSVALNNAINNAVQFSNIFFTVSAGNSGTDACTQSPASSEHAMTVGAIGMNHKRARYSNYGSCVDVYTPGSLIKSASQRSDEGSSVMDGTSMASPLVAGVAAIYYETNPLFTTDEVRSRIIDSTYDPEQKTVSSSSTSSSSSDSSSDSSSTIESNEQSFRVVTTKDFVPVDAVTRTCRPILFDLFCI